MLVYTASIDIFTDRMHSFEVIFLAVLAFDWFKDVRCSLITLDRWILFLSRSLISTTTHRMMAQNTSHVCEWKCSQVVICIRPPFISARPGTSAHFTTRLERSNLSRQERGTIIIIIHLNQQNNSDLNLLHDSFKEWAGGNGGMWWASSSSSYD